MNRERIDAIRKQLLQGGPILRTAELRKAGIFSKDIKELQDNHIIEKIKTGFYIRRDHIFEVTDSEIAAAVISGGTVCLFSAALLHGLSTVIPVAVDIAAPYVGKKPVLPDYPPIRLIRYRKPEYELGRSAFKTDHGSFPIYDRERTVCDFLKRHKTIGRDAALEVLKTYMRGGQNIQRLYEYADALGIRKTLHPYMEALL